MQKHRRDSVVQERTHLLTFNFSSSTRGERDTILKSLSYHTMLTPPPTLGTFRGVLDLNSSSGRDSKNLTTATTVENSTLWQRTQFSAPMVEAQLSAGMVQCQPSTGTF